MNIKYLVIFTNEFGYEVNISMVNQRLLEVKNLKKYFHKKGISFRQKERYIRAVDGISFHLFPRETLGLVGESGCGKSTTARLLLRLITPTSGSIIFKGIDLLNCSKDVLAKLRKDIQIIFQDPYASLNPRMTVGAITQGPLNNYKIGNRVMRRKMVEELIHTVGLSPEHIDRYPHEFSGGQRQRIGIARALALRPSLIICDEPVSALDVSIQSQILNLLNELKAKFDLSYLFISHDLSVVKHMSNRIAIMYLGKIVETAKKDIIYSGAIHPYTKALISAIPIPDPEVEQNKEEIILDSDVFTQDATQMGCLFYKRCPERMDICSRKEPLLKSIKAEKNHLVACWIPRESSYS